MDPIKYTDATANNIMYYHYKYNAISAINEDVFNNMNDMDAHNIRPFVSPPITNKYVQSQQIINGANHINSKQRMFNMVNRNTRYIIPILLYQQILC